MLLNPSHKITFSGLPPDVLDAYVRYKKGTRALVAWFLQYSPSPNRRVKSLPIKELESLAQAASKKLRSLPDHVHFYFRETIAARKKLSKYFRGHVDESAEDVDTVNHEHFTTTLAQIYDSLCACCGHANSPSHQQPGSKHQLAQPPTGLVNAYNSLSVEDADADDNEGDEHVPALSTCPECTVSTPPSCNDGRLKVLFSDDELGTLLEATAAVERIKDMTSAVERCWDLAGKNHLSFSVASLVTNVAFASIRQVGIGLLEHDETLTVSGLHRTVHSFERSSQGGACPSPENDETTTTRHVLLDQLQNMEQALLHYRDGHRSFDIRSCPTCVHVQKPADYLQMPLGEDCSGRHRLAEAILDNIYHLVTSSDTPTSIVRNSSPVYADAGYVVTRLEEQAQSWSAVLGLHLLTAGYRSYLQSIDSANAISTCRLTALRLAQQASSQIATLLNDKTCWPCRCTQTLAFHLQNLEADLRAYTKHRCWDLYFQAPWVAGNHVLEMLDLCHYYGMRVVNYRHYVAAILHCYNVLQQLGGLGQIPVLESLCTQLRGVFFPGGNRPKANFRACWSRYVGARLKFKKGHRRNDRDSWCMAIPAHAARRAAGLGSKSEHAGSRLDCLLFKIKQQDYHLSDEQWYNLDRASTHPGVGMRDVTRRGSLSISTSACDLESESNPGSGPLLALAETLQRTCDQSESTLLPTPRLNLFAVFPACVQVVSRLSDVTHTREEDRGMNCICFVSSILAAADRLCDSRRLGRIETWKKTERDCVELTKDAIQDVFGNVTAEQWLWDV
ncbi:hypothetical protein A1O3_07899 [Capronia epimyces CBS 606.96]|uniref:DUF6604 domain-containing protein n=1 Tax=Capronia epimyces CBS 606.96 TaxID=1182542 RepID=W9XQL4_9EURO|nr:uncharacterized protein A1O3_07899 [Capronia epimyces CBS 606.96]EXJ79620.1 hypothetical protein A1O3_07899 [Capronia epimyces CBS 606.96]